MSVPVAVTLPRKACPGDLVFITSRITHRFYLLRPDREVNEAIKYILAHYAKKYGIQLFAVMVLSTHLHLVLRDLFADVSGFMRDVDRAIANFLKAHHGWRGAVFEGHPNQTRLLTLDALVDKIAYTLANPVAAGAVRKSEDWPGFKTRVDDMGNRPVIARRPKKYFSPNGTMPETAELNIEMPAELIEAHGDKGAREVLERALREHEAEARKAVADKGWKFLGPDRCMKLSPYKRAKAYEVFGDRNPTFATKGGGPDLFHKAVAELRAFRAAYREAFEKWRAGFRDVVWPHGTYMMRIIHGAVCMPPPPS